MSHHGVRVFLWIVACAAVAAGAYYVSELERAIAATESTARVFQAQSHEAAVLVERLRGAQQSYVADGQGTAFWMGKVTDTAGQLGQSLSVLERTATTDAARTAAQQATAALADFDKLDRRARDYVQAGQRLTASDLIFTESLGATTALAMNIDRARTEQQVAGDLEVHATRQQELYVLGGAAAACLLIALLLVAPVRKETPKDTRDALRALLNDGTPAGHTLLRPDQPAPKPQPVAAPAPAPAPVRAAAPEPPPRPAAPSVDLGATARLCSDMARVLDPADLPRLLEQAAGLLDASGVIVWVADRAGHELFPTLAHGYGPAVLARMTSIPRDADNAAAAAWRLGEIRTVTAQGQTPGALVTPIITAEGCVGVLAAETRNGSEHDEARRAVSRILAAQLATLVTPVPATDPTDDQRLEVGD